MRSIRKRLVIWLLLGLALLWTTAGAGLYYAVRKGEFARLDARLDHLSNGVRFVGSMALRDALREARPSTNTPSSQDRPERGGSTSDERRDSMARWAQFSQEDGAEYYKVRTRNGEAFENASQSLAGTDIDLPPSGDSRDTVYFDTRLDDGTPVRAMAFSFRAGFGRGRPPRNNTEEERRPTPELDGVVAIDSGPMRETLATLLLGIAGVGCLAALASVGLVHFALRDGLKPLEKLGEDLSKVDARSLSGRFSNKSMPTELAPICEHLNALMGRLEKGFERERRFSADLAHELRTPVAELRTMAEVALKWPEGADLEQSEQTLEIAEQMGAIIDSLLSLGRLENGQTQAQLEPVDLAEEAASCWKPFAAAAVEKEVSVSLDLAPGSTIDADPEILRRIMTNLCSNAVAYTPTGGQIAITTSSGKLTISNDAPDILPEQLPHLFERFWRADGSRTDGSHSGLGLSVARACAKALGLKLEASHENGRLQFSLENKPEKTLIASS